MTEKNTGVTERFAVQSTITFNEQTGFEKALADLNVKRREAGRDKIYSSRLFRCVIQTFIKDPQAFLKFIGYR